MMYNVMRHELHTQKMGPCHANDLLTLGHDSLKSCNQNVNGVVSRSTHAIS